MINNYKAIELTTRLLPILMNGKVTVNSYVAGEENEELGMVDEGGIHYKSEK
jgi:hypothetical protein